MVTAPVDASSSADFVALIEATRTRCLWFLRADYLPNDRSGQLETLKLIKRYGNRDDYVRARRLEEWLQQNSSAAFSVS